MLESYQTTLILAGVLNDSTVYERVTKIGDPIFDTGIYHKEEFIYRTYKEYCFQAGQLVNKDVFKDYLFTQVDSLKCDFEASEKQAIKGMYDAIIAYDMKDIPMQIINTTIADIVAAKVNENVTSKLLNCLNRTDHAAQLQAVMSDGLSMLSVADNNTDGSARVYALAMSSLEKNMIYKKSWPTGVDYFDRATRGGVSDDLGGLKANELNGLLAPSGGGKTIFTFQIAMNWIKQSSKHKACVVLYEQDVKGDITERLFGLTPSFVAVIFGYVISLTINELFKLTFKFPIVSLQVVYQVM